MRSGKSSKMNERIKELNIQALVEVLNGQDPDNDIDKMYIPAQFTKKFAELIVKECGVALSPMLRDMVSRGQAYDLIKQHFGVEE
jgi:hypothetical protein